MTCGQNWINLQPKGPPLPQILVSAPAKLSPRLAAMVVLVTSSGCPRVVTYRVLSAGASSYLSRFQTHFEQVQTGSKEQVAELDGLLLKLRRKRLIGLVDNN